jgi:hypothetical protein
VGALYWLHGGGALPFQGIVGLHDYEGALLEYRWGLRSRAGDFVGTRFDPFDDEIRGVLRGIDGTLQGCANFQGDEVAGCMAGLASDGGCSMSLLFHNICSAKGANLELLEAEMRMWTVPWDVVGLTEAMLARVGQSHSYGTRAACSGLVVSTGDHRMVGYRIPTEWGTLTEEQRAIVSVAGFKRSSKGDFLVQCGVASCWMCGR